MNCPLVSVIIPTANRPHYLPRSVESALAGMVPGEVEVIVVPNGPDQSWKKSLKAFTANPQVTVSPIEQFHACSARNHGLSLATGVFVRFLDDDDYLYPKTAIKQYEMAQESNADICSGAVDIVNESGQILRIWPQPKTLDFIVATLTPERVTQPTAHVFRRSFLTNQRWDENISIRQDTDWMMRLCHNSEVCWVRFDKSVGAWLQHNEIRVSRGTDPGSAALKNTAEDILHIVNQIQVHGKLTLERKTAAANGLWSSVQKGFVYDPFYWIGIAKKARNLARNSKPPSKIYHLKITKKIDPIFIVFLISPARWIYLRFIRLWKFFSNL